MIKEALIILILASSIPAGYILAYLCIDELVSGRKWFKLLALVSFILALVLLFFYRNLTLIFTSAYIFIVSLISYIKSKDKKFVKRGFVE